MIDVAALKAAMQGLTWERNFSKTALANTLAGQVVSFWRVGTHPAAASNPSSSGEALDVNSQGAMPLPTVAAGEVLRLVGVQVQISNYAGVYVMDRLVQTSMVDWVTQTTQTFTHPPLPSRAGSGVGAQLFIECNASTSSGTFTPSVSYTNSDGVAGRIATMTVPSGFRSANGYFLPLQSGDKGVQSVQSVTFTGSGVNTGGLWSVAIYKRVITLPTYMGGFVREYGPLFTGCAAVPSDAALWVCCTSLTTTGPSLNVNLRFVKAAS